MKKFVFSALLTSLLWWVHACSYDLSIEGKACDNSHHCPAGFSCVYESENGHCTATGDDGGYDCVSGEKRCAQDLIQKEICEDNIWISYDCSPGYCKVGECISEQACVSSDDCDAGTWCGPGGGCVPKGNCEEPGVEKCDPLLKSIIVCSPESGQIQNVKDCQADTEYCDPFSVLCIPYCADDSDCEILTYTSCEPVSRKCLAMDVCTMESACPSGSNCVGNPGACVKVPTQAAALAGGEGIVDITCYIGDPLTPSPVPSTCKLHGGVVNFLNGVPSSEAPGLTIKIHFLSEVLKGNINAPIAETHVTEQGNLAAYSISDLPTNTNLVMEVGGESTSGTSFVRLLTFALFLRADDCTIAGGNMDFAAPALYQLNYDGYANAISVVSDPNKGLVFGQLKDCFGRKILNATGGISMPKQLLYYLQAYIPDDTLTSTGSTGFFVAANVIPIRGVASALVLSPTGPLLSLWEKEFRVFPGSASLILFEKPKAPR